MQVWKLIGTFMKKKRAEDDLFDQIKPGDLNDYFHSIMDGLTAKVWGGAPPARVCHACRGARGAR